MALPLWDPIALPPDYTLVDINSLTPESFMQEMQAQALQLWVDETGEPFGERDWSDDEGIFAVYDGGGDVVGVVIIVDVEDA